MSGKISKNALANYAGVFSQIIIAFLLSPFIVHTLGDTKYGIWSIVAALSGYMSLLDLGIASAITRYVAKYYQKENYRSLNEIVNSALMLFIAISAVLVAISPLTAKLLISAINFDEELEGLVRLVIIIVSFDIAVFVLCGVFRGVFAGLQRYDIVNFAAVIAAIYKALMIYVFLSKGYDLDAMAYISISANVFVAIIFALFLRRKYPFLTFGFRYISKASAGKILNFSKYTFIGMLANQIIYYSDAFVIGYFMSAAAVTYYTIPWSLTEYSKRFFMAYSRNYLPAFSELEASSNHAELKALFVSGTKVMLIISNLFCIGIMVMGESFLSLWMGAEYAEKCTAILIILFAAQMVQGPQLISHSLLLGISKHKNYSYMNMAVSVINLALSIYLIQDYGLIGVALGAAIPQVIFYSCVVPFISIRTAGLSFGYYFSETYLKLLFPSLLLFGVLFLFKSHYYPDTFGLLIIEATIAAVFYLFSIYFLSLDRQEQDKVRQIVGRLLGAVKFKV